MRIAYLVALTIALASATVVKGDLSFTRSDLRLEVQSGFTTVSLPRCISALDVGAPSLPIFVARIVIPQGTHVARVSTTPTAAAEVLICSLEVWPVQEPRSVSGTLPVGFTEPDPLYYGNSPYPADVAVVGKRGSLFGYNIASVFVAPVQYTASGRTLTFHPALNLRLETEPDDCAQQSAVKRGGLARRRIESSIERLVLNPADVSRFAPKER